MAEASGSDQASRRARFERVFRDHYAAVLAYARRRLPHAADDVTGETFLVAWRRFDELPDDPLPWLLATARLTIANQSRGERRSARLAVRLRIAGENGSIFDQPGRDFGPDRESAPLRALARLSPSDQEILKLVAWDALEPGRAAVVLGCSRGAFAVRLHRARRRFAVALRDQERGPSRGRTGQSPREPAPCRAAPATPREGG